MIDNRHFPKTYVFMESPEPWKIEVVWAKPDNPPSERSWIVHMYLKRISILYLENKAIPFVISIFPIRSRVARCGS